MSIWYSAPEIGWDDDDWIDGNLESIEPQLHGGEVRTYASGFSNHFPTTDDKVERRANVCIAEIPSFCVPGHSEENESVIEAVGPWLRLGLATAHHATSVAPEYIIPGEVNGAVVMDEAAVAALRDQLTVWLETPKVYPLKPDKVEEDVSL